MAKKGGAPENLDPVRSKDEAKKRGRNGGLKSGVVRRNKRDAKNAMKHLLDLAAKGTLKDNLTALGIESDDQTNMMALQARMFTMAMQGNLQAYEKIMKLIGDDPEEKRRERESLSADSRRERETQARIESLTHHDNIGDFAGEDFDDEDVEDVIIMLPENGRDNVISANTSSNGKKTDTESEGDVDED